VHYGVTLVGKIKCCTIITYWHVLVHTTPLDGVPVDPDVVVPVGPRLRVDQPQGVKQLVGDQSFPLGESSTEGIIELEVHLHGSLVIRTFKVSCTERSCSDCPAVSVGTKEAEIITRNTVVRFPSSDSQNLILSASCFIKPHASVVFYFAHDFTDDSSVLFNNRVLEAIVDDVVGPVPQVRGERSRPVREYWLLVATLVPRYIMETIKYQQKK